MFINVSWVISRESKNYDEVGTCMLVPQNISNQLYFLAFNNILYSQFICYFIYPYYTSISESNEKILFVYPY